MADFDDDFADDFDAAETIDTDDGENLDEKSKSQLKREADHLQQQGERLIQLTPNVLAELALPEVLRDAVLAAKKIKARSAWKRQRQYIGRLMRELDVEHVLEQLTQMDRHHAQSTDHFHNLENWRDRIIAEGEPAIEELLAINPDADRQRLRQLYRQTLKEQSTSQAPKAARTLFQYLKEILGNRA